MTTVNLEGDDVFLIDPRHTAYVTGQSPYLQDGALPWVKRIIILLLVILSIGLFLSEFIIADEGFITTDAEIITLNEVSEANDDGEQIIYVIVYRFQDVDGNTVTNEQDITREVFTRLASESHVSIRYLPALAERAELDVAQTQFFEQVRGTLFLLVIFIVILIYVLVFWVIRPGLRNQRLETEGVLFKAKLSNAYPTTGWLNTHIIHVDFHFSPPDDDTITGKVSKYRPDLKKKSLPLMGTAMTVLYVNNRLWRAM